jgi:hypothetical protein
MVDTIDILFLFPTDAKLKLSIAILSSVFHNYVVRPVRFENSSLTFRIAANGG